MALNDFVINTDTTTDKIVYVDDSMESTGIVVPNGQTVLYSKTHGLNYLFLPEMIWSLSPTFETSYNATSFVASTAAGRYYDVRGFLGADLTNIDVAFTNVSGASVTVYVKIYGLFDDTIGISDSYISSPVENGNIYSYNTDFNYDKIFLTGRKVGNGSIQHGYGTYPSKTKIWFQTNGVVFPSAENNGYIVNINTLPTRVGVYSDSTTLYFAENSPPDAYIYRIYV